MPGEFYFMAVGGLGVTLAGFAGLIAALDGGRESGHTPIAAWRIRNVVYQGFGVTFVGFGTVALYAVTQEVALTVRLATVGAVLAVAANWRTLQRGPAWPDERRRRVAIAVRAAACAAALVNVALASLGYLELFLLLVLSGPASTFILAVADVTRSDDSPSRSIDSQEVPAGNDRHPDS
jgi:hypothetical protein